MFSQDANGNTVLHMLVIHNLRRMYVYLRDKDMRRVERWKAKHPGMDPCSILSLVVPPRLIAYFACSCFTLSLYPGVPESSMMPPRLESVLNNKKLSPLTLAAKNDNLDMFLFLMNQQKSVMWQVGSSTFSLVLLESFWIPLLFVVFSLLCLFFLFALRCCIFFFAIP